MPNEDNYLQDAIEYVKIRKRYDELQDSDVAGAFRLMKDSLALYDRWSKILFDVRRTETKETKDPPFKDRVDDMCRILREINTETRMLWNKGEEDLRNNRGR